MDRVLKKFHKLHNINNWIMTRAMQYKDEQRNIHNLADIRSVQEFAWFTEPKRDYQLLMKSLKRRLIKQQLIKKYNQKAWNNRTFQSQLRAEYEYNIPQYTIHFY